MAEAIINNPSYKTFFQLIRFALGTDTQLPQSISATEWKELYNLGVQQSLIGVLFEGIKQLPEELLPDEAILMQWYGDAEYIAEVSDKAEKASQMWTRKYEDEGFRTCILKGQGNAAMYDEPKSRTAGDIDIYVFGGQEKVLKQTAKMGFTGDACYHHIHLDLPEDAVPVEVHYRASYGGLMDKYNKRIELWLDKEIQHTTPHNGYSIPSNMFNKIMQLAHMQHHFAFDGMSLRQLMDYYYVLSKEKDCDMTKELEYLGLSYFAEGIMYIMQQIFHLDKSHFIIAPERRRGEIILANVMEGGRFGFYRNDKYGDMNFITRNIHHTADLIYFCYLFPNQYYKMLIRYTKRFVYKRILGKEYEEEDL